MCTNISACRPDGQKKADREVEGKGKTLVAYFSATGTTAKAAQKIAAETGGELFEIVPEQLYTAADWTGATSSRAVRWR